MVLGVEVSDIARSDVKVSTSCEIGITDPTNENDSDDVNMSPLVVEIMFVCEDRISTISDESVTDSKADMSISLSEDTQSNGNEISCEVTNTRKGVDDA